MVVVMVVVVVSDCILTSTSFVLTPRNIISPIAHRHQVAISWSRHVQRRTKRFDFADSDQSNFVRGSPSSVFPLPGRQIVSRSRSLRYPMSRKFLPFLFLSPSPRFSISFNNTSTNGRKNSRSFFKIERSSRRVKRSSIEIKRNLSRS